eukprot:g2220.t1
MGSCLGTASIDVHHHHYTLGNELAHVESIDGVVKPSDMPYFYKIFNQIDVDKSGKIDVNEFLDYIKLPRSSIIGRKVFGLFDDDHSKKIDFSEFANSIWKFCSFNESSLMEFSLRLVDSSGDGKIQVSELKSLISMTTGSIPLQSQVKGIFLKLDPHGRGHVTVERWIEYVKKHPSMAYAAFDVQKRLRDHIGGLEFWEKQLTNLNSKQSMRLTTVLKKMSKRHAVDEIGKINSRAEKLFKKKQEAGLLDSLGRPTNRGTRVRKRKSKVRHHHHHHHRKSSCDGKERVNHRHSDGWIPAGSVAPKYELRVHTTHQ